MEAEAEAHVPILIEEAGGRIGKGLGALEGRDRFLVEEVDPARLTDANLGDAPVLVERDVDDRDASA